jgi:hypothetical protein
VYASARFSLCRPTSSNTSVPLPRDLVRRRADASYEALAGLENDPLSEDEEIPRECGPIRAHDGEL